MANESLALPGINCTLKYIKTKNSSFKLDNISIFELYNAISQYYCFYCIFDHEKITV